MAPCCALLKFSRTLIIQARAIQTSSSPSMTSAGVSCVSRIGCLARLTKMMAGKAQVCDAECQRLGMLFSQCSVAPQQNGQCINECHDEDCVNRMLKGIRKYELLLPAAEDKKRRAIFIHLRADVTVLHRQT